MHGAGGIQEEGRSGGRVGSDLRAPNVESAFPGAGAIGLRGYIVVGKILKAGQAPERTTRDVADHGVGIIQQFGEQGRQPVTAGGLQRGFPAAVPGQGGALAGIAGQNPGDGSGRLLLLGTERGNRFAEPLLQLAGSPTQAPVQVAEVARIRPPWR